MGDANPLGLLQFVQIELLDILNPSARVGEFADSRVRIFAHCFNSRQHLSHQQISPGIVELLHLDIRDLYFRFEFALDHCLGQRLLHHPVRKCLLRHSRSFQLPQEHFF